MNDFKGYVDKINIDFLDSIRSDVETYIEVCRIHGEEPSIKSFVVFLIEDYQLEEEIKDIL